MMSATSADGPSAHVVTREIELSATRAPVRVIDAGPREAALARLVIVHGYGEHAGCYAGVAALMASHGVAVTIADLPGHGTGDGEPGELGDAAELDALLHAVCDLSARLHGDAPLVLLGHSLGGLIAAAFAARSTGRCSGIVLSAPVIGRWSAIDAFAEVSEIPPSMIRARHLSSVASFADIYDSDPLRYRGPVRRSTLAWAQQQLDELADGASFEGLPVLWLHGSADRVVPAHDALHALADYGTTDLTARLFEGARHEVLNDHCRDAAIELICEFAISRNARLTDPLDKTGEHDESRV